jgi:hypothetical protein
MPLNQLRPGCHSLCNSYNMRELRPLEELVATLISSEVSKNEYFPDFMARTNCNFLCFPGLSMLILPPRRFVRFPSASFFREW